MVDSLSRGLWVVNDSLLTITYQRSYFTDQVKFEVLLEESSKQIQHIDKLETFWPPWTNAAKKGLVAGYLI